MQGFTYRILLMNNSLITLEGCGLEALCLPKAGRAWLTSGWPLSVLRVLMPLFSLDLYSQSCCLFNAHVPYKWCQVPGRKLAPSIQSLQYVQCSRWSAAEEPGNEVHDKKKKKKFFLLQSLPSHSKKKNINHWLETLVFYFNLYLQRWRKAKNKNLLYCLLHQYLYGIVIIFCGSLFCDFCTFSIICEIISQQKFITREPLCFADRQMDNSVAYCVS